MKIIKDIFKYRELLKNNVKKEVRGRYKNSILGVMWTFLNPLLQIAVYAMIFPYILKQQQPYYHGAFLQQQLYNQQIRL